MGRDNQKEWHIDQQYTPSVSPSTILFGDDWRLPMDLPLRVSFPIDHNKYDYIQRNSWIRDRIQVISDKIYFGSNSAGFQEGKLVILFNPKKKYARDVCLMGRAL